MGAFGWVVLEPVVAAAVHGHHGAIVDCILELDVSLLLNSLSILQLLDQLHLKHLHLHDLGLLLSYNLFFFSDLPGDVLARLLLLFASELFHLGSLYLLLLLLNLGFHVVLLGHLVIELLLPLLALHVDELGLLCLFLLMHNDGVFYFALFDDALVPQLLYAHPLLLGPLLLILSLLHFLELLFLVLCFQPLDLVRSLPGLFDFLPRFGLFLLQKCNSVGQQLCVSLGAKKKLGPTTMTYSLRSFLAMKADLELP